MDIKYLGHSSFRLRGKQTAVVTDPFDKTYVGLKYPPVNADIVTISHEHNDHNAVSEVKQRGERPPVIIRGPGEYEVGGVKIFGFGTYHDKQSGAERGKNTMYRIEIDGISVLHCGDLGHVLSDAVLDELDTINILIIPIGGITTISEKEAAKVVAQIEPSIVIPMHYKRPGLTSAYDTLSPVESFLKAIDKKSEPTPKLTVVKGSLPQELEVVLLQS